MNATGVTSNFTSAPVQEGNPDTPATATNHTIPDTTGEISGQMLTVWVVCEIISILFTTTAIYILVALLTYISKWHSPGMERRRRKRKVFPHKGTASGSDIKSSRSIPGSRQHNSSDRGTSSGSSAGNSAGTRIAGRTTSVTRGRGEVGQQNWLLRSIVLCVALAILRGFIEQVLILAGHTSSEMCNGITRAITVITALTIHACHGFLWLRQQTFYSSPVLRKLSSRRMKMLSYTAYAAMFITLVVTLGLYMWWREHEAVDGVCRAAPHENMTVYVPFGILAFCTVTIQILLSVLFVYPLYVHKREREALGPHMSNRNSDQTSQRNATGEKSKRNTDKLMVCIRRVLRGATISITSDVTGAIVAMFLPYDMPSFATNVLYHSNISFNLICLIYTFSNWRQMIFPWCNRESSEEDGGDGARSRSSVSTSNHNVGTATGTRTSCTDPPDAVSGSLVTDK